MRVFRSLAEAAGFGPSALTIGNFDGVHRAHRALLRQVVEKAGTSGWHASVLTFDPHPTRVIAPARAPRLLTTLNQRLVYMEEQGIDAVLALPFTLETARWTPEEFVQRVLVDGLQTRAVFVGDNFRFGHKQAGDTRLLRELGERFGFSTEIVDAVQWRGKVVSSSAVREELKAGAVGKAARLLARPHFVEGNVVSGHGIGSKQTVPTLNLETASETVPADGVYATRARDLDDGRLWPSITNVGMRPTFDGDARTIETFLLAPLDGDTPRRLRIEFLRWIREERKFAGPAELRAQILRDVERAKAFHRRISRLGGSSPESTVHDPLN